MARSHHRKKHKQHLRQFKSSHDSHVAASAARNKVSGRWMFAIAGFVVGFAIGFFASGSAVWIAVGTIVGTATGYFIGKRVDEGKTG
ncbi:MAG: hypothetical protein HOP10_09920 [Chitinophagaceae bacterium]|nr:hypothetical protein [Chitinophagaceae bacterium]